MSLAIPSWRRGLSAALAALHLGLVLGTVAHQGPHLEDAVAQLPAELHHHAYGFATARPDVHPLADPCLACMLSRVVPRLPAPASEILPGTGAAVLDLPVLAATLPTAELDPFGPRAPPVV